MNKTKELIYWINEREAMRQRKESGIPIMHDNGWSKDPHMGLVRYCNIRREDDKVTRWLAKNWRPNHHKVWEIVLARMINYIPSLRDMLNDTVAASPALRIDRAFKTLKERRNSGEKIFTSAYTISTCGQSMDKIDYVMDVVEDVKIDEKINPYDWGTLERFHHELMQVKGLGSFLAAQVVADLKNTKGHPLENASDWHTWAAPGPGSLKGLTEYFGGPITPSQFTGAINLCWREVKDHVPDLHMQDFQNCLCEFSKYERVKRGGHVRNRYSAG